MGNVITDIYSAPRSWNPSGNLRIDPSKKADVVLISPWSRGSSHKVFVAAPPRGLWELEAWNKIHGIPTLVFDPNMQPLESLFDFIQTTKPRIIGSSLLHNTIINDREIMEEARRLSPTSLFLIGGIEVTTDWQNILPWFPADIGVIGSGEKPLTSIWQQLPMLSKDLAAAFGQVPGLVIKKSPSQLSFTGCSNPLTPNEYEAKMQAFSWGEIPYESYWQYEEGFGQEYLEESRHVAKTIRVGIDEGCRKHCVFCVNTALREAGVKHINALNVTNIVDSIEEAARTHPGVQAFMLDAETLLGGNGQRRIIELCREIVRRGLNRYGFFCRGRVDYVTSRLTPQTLRAMKEANFIISSLGIETDSQPMLDIMEKGTTTEMNRKAVLMLSRYGITPRINIILFLPFKSFSRDDLCRTIEACLSWYGNGAEINISLFLEPYPGTPVSRMGLETDSENFTFSTGDGDYSYRHQKFLLPYDEKIRNLALQSIEDASKKYFSEFARRMFPERDTETIPKWLHNLSLFYAIYKLMGRDTSGIERAVSLLQKRNLQPD